MTQERAEKTGRVVNIDFYPAGKLPSPLAQEAQRQGFRASRGLVAVKTLIGSPPSYEFEEVGSNPSQVKAYMVKIAKEDGADLNEAVKAAYAEKNAGSS